MTKKREELLNEIKERSGKRGGNRIQNRVYRILEGNENSRLSPQALKCLEILFATDKNEMSEQEVFDLFDKAEMKTKQTAWKVFQYYRKILVDQGFIVIEKPAAKND